MPNTRQVLAVFHWTYDLAINFEPVYLVTFPLHSSSWLPICFQFTQCCTRRRHCFDASYNFDICAFSICHSRRVRLCTQRRRQRRQRALARALWNQHKLGVKRLSSSDLAKIASTLSKHHSRDPHFIKHIKMAEDSYPWRCYCGRLNGKKHNNCPDRKRHWSSGVPHPNAPKSPRASHQDQKQSQQPKQSNWDWHNTQHQPNKQNRKGDRSESARRKKGKGKGKKSHESGNMQPSPFAQPSTIPPWPTPEPALSQQQTPIPPSQQKQYGEQLSTAQQQWNIARRHLQQLNKQAAEVGAPVTADTGAASAENTEAESSQAFETEAQALLLQVQESLQQSIAAAADPEDLMEIHSDSEADHRSKRPRSMEPFGGPLVHTVRRICMLLPRLNSDLLAATLRVCGMSFVGQCHWRRWPPSLMPIMFIEIMVQHAKRTFEALNSTQWFDATVSSGSQHFFLNPLRWGTQFCSEMKCCQCGHSRHHGQPAMLFRPCAHHSGDDSKYTHKKVQFLPFAEVIESYFPPRVEPHRDNGELIAEQEITTLDHLDDDELHLMARAPRPRSPSSSGIEGESDLQMHPPTSPASPIGPRERWRSVRAYDLRSNFARGRIQTQPPEYAFAEACRLLGYTHHEIANIFTITPSPPDLAQLSAQPLLLVRHDDINIGDNGCAILIGVELRGSTFESVIGTDRYTTLLPTPKLCSLPIDFPDMSASCITCFSCPRHKSAGVWLRPVGNLPRLLEEFSYNTSCCSTSSIRLHDGLWWSCPQQMALVHSTPACAYG